MITLQKSYPKLAKAVGVSSLFLKREDLHPYGSHKGRSIPVMIDVYLKEGKRHFAISSSGNAALAAAMYVKKLNKESKIVRATSEGGVPLAETSEADGPSSRNFLARKYPCSARGIAAGAERADFAINDEIKLEILVGNHIPEHKLKKLTDLADDDVSVLRFERPLMTLTQKTADGSVQSLRQSTDNSALVGYESLAKELDEIKDLRAVFMPTSSGTTAEALARYFLDKARSKKQEAKIPEVHIVQTTSCHPIAEEFTDSLPSNEFSIADAIVDITAHRKAALVPLIKKTGGTGWIATNEEIGTARGLVVKYAGFDISSNGALGVAGLVQAVENGMGFDGVVACVIGGE